jgi:hypothetical protein
MRFRLRLLSRSPHRSRRRRAATAVCVAAAAACAPTSGQHHHALAPRYDLDRFYDAVLGCDANGEFTHAAMEQAGAAVQVFRAHVAEPRPGLDAPASLRAQPAGIAARAAARHRTR